jgi:peptidoglycan/LPS O-acetylase OafA/YrhL
MNIVRIEVNCEMSANQTGSGRIDFLDSTRGLAALAVLFGHSSNVLVHTSRTRSLLSLPLLNAAFDGTAAVAMFFVLSGFVLSRPYLKTSVSAQPRPLKLAPFYVKRITRIWLPFLCVLLLSALAKACWFRTYATVPAQSEWFQQFWRQPLGLPLLLKQCFFLLPEDRLRLLNQDWSLGVELKASALLPFLLLAFRRGERWLLLIACLFLFRPGGHYYVAFILGILLAAHQAALVRLVGNRKLAWVLVCVGLAFYQARLILREGFHLQGGSGAEKLIWTATSLGCVLLLLGIFSSQQCQKVLNHRVFVFLGRVSYGVYLLQFIVLLCIIPWLVSVLNRWGLRQESFLLPMVLLSSALITIAAAAVFYEAVEEPCIRLGHRFASAYSRKKAEPKPKQARAGAIGPANTTL